MLWKKFCAGVVAAAIPAVAFAADKPTAVPPGTPVNITVTTASSDPEITIKPYGRTGHATPTRTGCSHTGGGNVIVTQPSADTLVVTLTGSGVAAGAPGCGAVAAWDFDIEQCFDVVFANKETKLAKLTVGGNVIGVLRSHCKGAGSAAENNASAAITCGPQAVTHMSMPPHSVAGGENLSINDQQGPVCVPVPCGKYTLHMTWHLDATAAKCLLPCKSPSFEFAPDALDALWLSSKEPFHGIKKDAFGFSVKIHVEPWPEGEEAPAPAAPAGEPIAPPVPAAPADLPMPK
jgi:hypothetical protein